jgi:hypothetical protein
LRYSAERDEDLVISTAAATAEHVHTTIKGINNLLLRLLGSSGRGTGGSRGGTTSGRSGGGSHSATNHQLLLALGDDLSNVLALKIADELVKALLVDFDTSLAQKSGDISSSRGGISTSNQK